MSKPTEYFFWIVDSETPPGKRIKTRHRMTRETALERHGASAEPILSSREVRDLPETDEEMIRTYSHSINQGKPRG